MGEQLRGALLPAGLKPRQDIYKGWFRGEAFHPVWIERDYLLSWRKVLDGEGEKYKGSYSLIRIGVNVWQFAVQENVIWASSCRQWEISGKAFVQFCGLRFSVHSGQRDVGCGLQR